MRSRAVTAPGLFQPLLSLVALLVLVALFSSAGAVEASPHWESLAETIELEGGDDNDSPSPELCFTLPGSHWPEGLWVFRSSGAPLLRYPGIDFLHQYCRCLI